MSGKFLGGFLKDAYDFLLRLGNWAWTCTGSITFIDSGLVIVFA